MAQGKEPHVEERCQRGKKEGHESGETKRAINHGNEVTDAINKEIDVAQKVKKGGFGHEIDDDGTDHGPVRRLGVGVQKPIGTVDEHLDQDDKNKRPDIDIKTTPPVRQDIKGDQGKNRQNANLVELVSLLINFKSGSLFRNSHAVASFMVWYDNQERIKMEQRFF
ncbi:MAG: hypothetical protein BWY44_00062 [Candidatus Omnitrophica bacterium ADurb.Bin292]|nr:MAG: hypothetical protein BWY44_00062 [Candidatus Omnitrophica bacterium ADurb.Bin292]